MQKADSDRMDSVIRSLAAPCVAFALAVAPVHALAGKIVAEKNCSVRIDEEFGPGQKIFVVREQGGKSKKVAVVQVSRAAHGLSLGKVVQGPKQCASLMGLSVERAGGSKSQPAKGGSGGSGGGSAGLAQPALDADAQFLYIMFSGKGLHQRTDEPVPSLNLFGFGVHADVWPGAFVNKRSFIAQMFGLGLRYSNGIAIPEIDVMPPKDSQSQELGKQQTKPSTLLFEGAARFPYLDGKLATEARVGYLTHSTKHTLSAKGGLPRAPLRDVSYSGVSLGLTQRIRLIEMVRANVGFTFPVTMSGHSDITSERTVDRTAAYDGPLKSPAGFIVDASVDGIVSKFKITAGLTYETYGAKIDLADNAGEHVLDETFITFLVGVGVFL